MKSDDLIYMYMQDNRLNMDKVVDDFSSYLYTVVQNAGSFKCEDIEEIISDTYLILWNNQEKLDIDKAMLPYLVGIIKNVIRKKYKVFYEVKENIEDFAEQLIENENIEITVTNKEINDKIFEILNHLKKEEREIFEAFYYNQLKIIEISMMLNISESKAKTKLHRIRKKIRKELLKGGYGIYG